jgi:hypothetical protein
VLASLKNGPMRHEIGKTGGLKLIIYSLQRVPGKRSNA